jgi:hypothetical protein
VLALGAACGGRPQPDDASLHSAVLSGSTGREVTFDARLLGEPQRFGTHEHLLVLSPSGDRLEIDHNVDLAPWVPAHANDAVTVRGQLYVDAPNRAGVHCTHARTSTGCPQPGWIQLHGSYYE